KTRTLIDDGYNTFDAENTWIISFGERAPSATIARAKLGGGALFALLALIFSFSGLKKKVFGTRADEYEGILGAPIPTGGAPMSHIPPMKSEIDAPLVPQSNDPAESTAEDVVEAA
ncbi:MAG: hypothetical protein ACYTF7_11875, partial [Planctomycetota bacterium]